MFLNTEESYSEVIAYGLAEKGCIFVSSVCTVDISPGYSVSVSWLRVQKLNLEPMKVYKVHKCILASPKASKTKI